MQKIIQKVACIDYEVKCLLEDFLEDVDIEYYETLDTFRFEGKLYPLLREDEYDALMNLWRLKQCVK